MSATPQIVAAVSDPASAGVRRYVERLAAALAAAGVDYRPVTRPLPGRVAHVHLANSTRAVLPAVALRREPFLVTVHDVLPRARVLRPLQRALVLPLCVARAARIVVHSEHAADLLAGGGAVARDRILVLPHPASPAPGLDRAAARTLLGLGAGGPPLFVLPGVLKGAKLVAETLAAAAPLLAAGRARLLLAGHVADETLAAQAAAAGAVVVRDPDDAAYAAAIAAADAVLCLRADSVGESNGPLLDAIGAGRPSLVTGVGSAPETAGAAAHVVPAHATGIRAGLEALLDDDRRDVLAAAACERAADLTWAAAGRRHADLLREVAHA